MGLLKMTCFYLLLLSMPSAAFAQITHRLDSIISDSWIDNAWYPVVLTTYKHGATNRIDEIVRKFNDGNGGWKVSKKTKLTYDNQAGLLEQKVDQEWSSSSSSWEDRWKQEHAYENGKIRAVNYSVKDFGSNSWTLYQIDSFSYDGAGRRTSFVVFRVQQNNATPYLRYNYLYKTSGNLEFVNHDYFKNGAFKTTAVNAYHQDSLGRDTAVYSYNVDTGNGSYSLESITQIERNNGNIHKKILGYGSSIAGFVFTTLVDYEVNSAVEIEHVLYPPTVNLTNDISHLLNSSISIQLKEQDTLTASRVRYFYDSTLQTGRMQLKKPEIEIYPNPCTSEIHLNVSEYPSAKSWVIVDLHGKKYGSQPIHENEEIEVGDLSSGLYVLQLFDAEGNTLGMARFIKK